MNDLCLDGRGFSSDPCRRRFRVLASTATAAALVLLLAGCGSSGAFGGGEAATERQNSPGRSADSSPGGKGPASPTSTDGMKAEGPAPGSTAGEGAKTSMPLEPGSAIDATWLEERVAIARQLLKRRRLDVEQLDAEMAEMIAAAQADVKLAEQRRDTFVAQEAAAMVDQANHEVQKLELEFQAVKAAAAGMETKVAADGAPQANAQQEQTQLSIIEREIVLRKKNVALLKNQTIPLRTAELENEVKDRKDALSQLQRKFELIRIDRRIALMEAESQMRRAEAELTAVTGEMPKEEP